MFPASTTKGGTCFAAPDVCKTPPDAVPMAFPNMADLASAARVAGKVLVENKEMVSEASCVPTTSLDEGGSMLGVKSGNVKGPLSFKTYSSKVYAEGKKVVHHTAVTAHNGPNPNVVGMQVSPSQDVVFVDV
jgi:hypothetical protein